jgi:hypothetical protein
LNSERSGRFRKFESHIVLINTGRWSGDIEYTVFVIIIIIITIKVK